MQSLQCDSVLILLFLFNIAHCIYRIHLKICGWDIKFDLFVMYNLEPYGSNGQNQKPVCKVTTNNFQISYNNSSF